MPTKKLTAKAKLKDLNSVFDRECDLAFQAMYRMLKASPIRMMGATMLGEELKLTVDSWPEFKKHEQEVAQKISKLNMRQRQMILEMSNHIRTVAINVVKETRPELVEGVKIL